MDEVRKNLAEAWEKLNQVGQNYNLKQQLNPGGLDSLLVDLDEVENLIHQAKKLAASYSRESMYVICSEVAPGHYDRFTHGPAPGMRDLLSASGVEDGQVLARVKLENGEAVYQPLVGYLDGEWLEIEE